MSRLTWDWFQTRFGLSLQKNKVCAVQCCRDLQQLLEEENRMCHRSGKAIPAALWKAHRGSQVRMSRSVVKERAHEVTVAFRERYGPLPDNQGSTLSSLSHFSMESNLGRQELNESLLSSLVDLCYAPDSSPIPVIKWGNLRKRFEQAGRRLHQLDSVAEPLVRCVMVMGALNSDAPALVGPGGASLDQLPFVRSTEELVRVGKHRHSVAAKLLEETEKCYDQKGLWRQSSPEAIAALTVR